MNFFRFLNDFGTEVSAAFHFPWHFQGLNHFRWPRKQIPSHICLSSAVISICTETKTPSAFQMSGYQAVLVLARHASPLAHAYVPYASSTLVRVQLSCKTLERQYCLNCPYNHLLALWAKTQLGVLWKHIECTPWHGGAECSIQTWGTKPARGTPFHVAIQSKTTHAITGFISAFLDLFWCLSLQDLYLLSNCQTMPA